jgi:hypothetical protein
MFLNIIDHLHFLLLVGSLLVNFCIFLQFYIRLVIRVVSIHQCVLIRPIKPFVLFHLWRLYFECFVDFRFVNYDQRVVQMVSGSICVR